MKSKILVVLIIFILLSIEAVSASNEKSINTSISADNFTHAKPSYSIVILNKDSNINPGENTFFDLYITGFGDLKYAKLNIFTDGGFVIKNYRFKRTDNKLTDWTPESNSELAIIQLMPIIYDYENFSMNMEYSPPPITAKSYIPPNITPGDHKIYAFLTYQDLNGNWYVDKAELQFHVNTWIERYWIIIAFGAVITVIAGAITIYKEVFKEFVLMRNRKWFE